MNSKLRAALVGGVVLGVLSGLPYISLGNVFCCMWVVAGGALASYLYIKKSPTPVDVGEGAMVGGMAGLIGAATSMIFGTPLSILMGHPELRLMIDLMERFDPQKAEGYREGLEQVISRPFAEQFFGSVFSLGSLLWVVIAAVFALVGGLLAVALFEKRKNGAGTPPPPPPQFYGGTPGGNYAPPPPPPPTPGSYGPSEV